MLQSLARTARYFAGHPVGSARPAATWGRWARWQVRSRLGRGPIAVPWIGGSTLIVDRGMTGATGNVYCGLHEFADMALVLHYLSGARNLRELSGAKTLREAGGGNRAGPARFADVGANVGSYTILAAAVAGAEVDAFEPTPTTLAALRRNVAANGVGDRVRVHPVAVGERDGTLRFSVDQDTTNRVVGPDYPGRVQEVPVRRLDGLLAGRMPAAVKMDVEGAEAAAIAGFGARLREEPPDLLLLEDDSPAVRELMAAAGFRSYGYDWRTRRTTPRAPAAGDGGPGGGSRLHNVLWTTDPAAIERATAAGGQFEVCGLSF